MCCTPSRHRATTIQPLASGRSSRRSWRSTRPTTSSNPAELGILEEGITRLRHGEVIVAAVQREYGRPRHAHDGEPVEATTVSAAGGDGPEVTDAVGRWRCPPHAASASRWWSGWPGWIRRRSLSRTQWVAPAPRASAGVERPGRRARGCAGRVGIGTLSIRRRLPSSAGRSFNGRTPRSGRGYRGSNPCLPANPLSPSSSIA